MGQDIFPSGYEYIEKLKKHKREIKQGKISKIKQMMLFFDITHAEIMPTIHKETSECGMTCWGNITVYVGKVRREACIDTLISKLGIKQDKRVESSFDRIALASFQIDPEGAYIEESFSLSPVLWAISEIGNKKDDIAKKLDCSVYNSDISALESEMFPKESEEEPYYVHLEDIDRLYVYLCEKYVRNASIKESDIEKSFVIMYQAFFDENAKERYEDDTYTGLSRDYFSNDIKIVTYKNEYGQLSETLQDYILSIYKKYMDDEKTDRIDVVYNSDIETYELQLNHILRIKNAPIGKWPSKYRPALMQQMAINLLIGKDIQEKFGKNGKVFSVNGPPGTGKTTLLKEVVANNVVERAVLLAEYNCPDDAFSRENFEHGTRAEHAYSNFVRHWYKLKNDKINDYSILVASCNNSAVENISKELPIGESLLEDLKANNNETQIIKEQLSEVYQLFDVSMSKDVENLLFWNKDGAKQCTDIYFTEYANELLNADNAWGLIAAPLGKKSNKKNFYYKVLSNLLRDFYQKKEFVESRKVHYKEARLAFLRQYQVVKNLQEQLDIYGEISEKRIIKIKEKKNIIEEKWKQIGIKQSIKEELYRNLEEIVTEQEPYNSKFKGIVSEKAELEDELQKIETDIQRLDEQLLDCREKTVSIQNSIGVFTRLLKTQKYKDSMKLAELYRNKGDDIQVSISNDYEVKVSIDEKLSELNKEYADIKKRIDDLNNGKELLQIQISDMEAQIRLLDNEKNEAQNAIYAIQEDYTNKIHSFINGETGQTGIVLDANYIQRIISDDIGKSTQAQVDNPWTTQLYDREREKLFYYAVKLHKEFVLSSKACRDNFKTLGHYWGYLPGDDNKIVEFRESDESGCVTALIQTLFLLVPVISSTFASISSFFKNVKQRDSIGLLIVDEAGQAQPQMALGALYRSRKAMIVGDPKQIEPVVTDDLKLLKETYREEVYNPYKEKDVSVQACADFMNPFGTYMENGSDKPDWIGCPLLVHRRCISPMYEISNTLSYNGTMKQQTQGPKPELEKKFIYKKSQWIHVTGKEQGNKNHFVKSQGEKVCEMLEIAFEKAEVPDVFIISPFTTVVKGMREYIRAYCKTYKNSPVQKALQEWIYKNIGTVHTFQGKEANEVIFLLGCDESKEAAGAIGWVSKNIVNVAVTRAKFRLYIIGDENAWSNSDYVNVARCFMKSVKNERR